MSLVGKKARNHRQKLVNDFIDDRRTPASLFEPLHRRYRFTLDAAASPTNAMLPKYFTKEDDGLLRSWENERVWCNPPYSRLEGWVAKAWDAMINEHTQCVVMILPANRTEQPFWQRLVEPFRDGRGSSVRIGLTTQFLPGRPHFTTPSGAKPKGGSRPPFGIVVLAWERRPS